MRPAGLEPISGYRSSKAQSSSSVRVRFVIFTLATFAQILFRGKPSMTVSCLLAQAVLKSFALDEKMIGHVRKFQDLFVEFCRIHGCFTPDHANTESIGQADNS